MIVRYLSANGEAERIAKTVADQIAHCIQAYDRAPETLTVRFQAVARRGGYTWGDVREFAEHAQNGSSLEAQLCEQHGFRVITHAKTGEPRFAPLCEADE